MNNGDDDQLLAKIDSATAFLASVDTVLKAKQAIALSRAAEVYAKYFGASVQTLNKAALVRLRSERRLGEILEETPLQQGSRGSKLPNDERSSILESRSLIPTLDKLRITRKQSSRAQAIAAIDDAEFENLVCVEEGKELNHNRIAKFALEKKQRALRRQERLKAVKSLPMKELDERIIVGDFRQFAHKVADRSVSLIFTDPPYNRKASVLLPALGEFAASKLALGGSLLCYVGQTQLPTALDAIRPHLRYWWTVACIHAGRRTVMREYGINVGWKAVLWFVNGTRDDNSAMVSDVMSGGEEKKDHDWQQAQSEAEYWIDKLCPKDGIVCDPFLGSGTTAAAAQLLSRKWVGFEIDPETAKIAASKVA